METYQVSPRATMWGDSSRPAVKRYEETNALLVRVPRAVRAPAPITISVKRSRGLATLPGRVGSTLKRKFWDSNELVSSTAVQARDILATLYVNGKESAVALVRQGGEQTVVIYRYARERAATTRLPYPFVPIRDRLVLPCFRAVEAVVQFLFSDRPSYCYREAKRYLESLPLGTTVVLPSIYFAEGVAHVTLVILQAPLPSSERVANTVEAVMELGKRGLRNVGREVYYYVQLVDFHVTRTLARAQWDILGFGPYASLPRERRMEVMERIVDRYLSIRIPIRRYEFMTQIQWQNSQLHDDLIGSELITQRGGSLVEGDTWLDPEATWRCKEEDVMGGDVQPLWFFWEDESKTWQPFQMFECRRLERAYRKHFKSLHGKSPRWTQNPLAAAADGRLLEVSSTEREGTSSAGPSGHSDSDRDSTMEETSPFSPENSATSLLQHEVGPHDVFVNQGRYVVDLLRFARFPVFWGYCGQGEPVRRGVWMHESKQGYLIPYPPRSASLLEDAYQYLKWYLAGQEAAARARAEAEKEREAALPAGRKKGSSSSQGTAQEEGILLNLQVDGNDGDQLVQFRSLVDIWAVRKTWVGALSLFSRRRVRRGYGPYVQARPRARTAEQEDEEEEEQKTQSPAKDEQPGSPITSDEEEADLTPRDAACEAGGDEAAVTVEEEGKAKGAEDLFPAVVAVEEKKDDAMGPPPALGQQEAQSPGRASEDEGQAEPSPSPAAEDGKEEQQPQQQGEVCEIKKVRGKWRAKRQVKSSVSMDGSGSDTSGQPSPVQSAEQQEDDDDADLNEPVEHLVLVVHGIGQAMKRVELGVTQLRSIVECCDIMRNNTDEIAKQADGETTTAGASGCSNNKLRGRIEFLPVEWHTKFREKAGEGEEVSSAGHLRLRDITLSRIPHLRSFVNDALLDVLYFMSPAYHQVILDEVAAEMNRIVTLFRKHTRNFSGKISIAAHSLGGVICFDLLANQESVVDLAEVRARERGVAQDPRRQHLKYGYTSYPKLQFNVVNMFGLGSPIAVFLLVRRQHQALHTDFCLARCRRMYNIFHPYDPVAYRLEPFISANQYDPDADLLPTWQGKYRVHYQVKKMVNRFWERLWQFKENLEDGIEGALEAVGLIEEREHPDTEDREVRESGPMAEAAGEAEENMWPEQDLETNMAQRYARYGRLCWGDRIDYSLQEKEIEITNEYIFALGAHVLYWASKDLSNFFLLQIKRHQHEDHHHAPPHHAPPAAAAGGGDAAPPPPASRTTFLRRQQLSSHRLDSTDA